MKRTALFYKDSLWTHFSQASTSSCPYFSHRHFSPCYKYVVVLCENSLSSRISCTLIYVSYVMYFLYLLMYYLQLEQKQVPPPYRPTLESDRDLHNFPPEFTDEPVQLTPDDS